MPSFCAAAAIGPTGNPTMPNMNLTPCCLRLLATKVAPSTSLMSDLLSERDHRREEAPLHARDAGDHEPGVDRGHPTRVQERRSPRRVRQNVCRCNHPAYNV